MAKLYTTGTINQPDAGSVGLAMADKIRDDVVAHAAWELVEEFTPASSAVRWTVLRCLAAQSGLPIDYYAIICRNLANGTLYFMVGEGYNDSSNVFSKFARKGVSSSPIAYDADGSAPETFTLGTAAPSTSSGQPAYLSWTPSGTSTKWWIIVDNDGFSVAFNGAANQFVHINAFTPLTQLAWTVPIGIMGSSDNNGYITRNPAAAGISAYQGALVVQSGGGGVNAQNATFLGFQGDLRYNDKLQNNERPVAEIGVHIDSVPGQNDYMAQIGYAAGKQKRIRYSSKSLPSGMAFGDAFVLDGTLWVPWYPTDGRIFDTGVPSS